MNKPEMTPDLENELISTITSFEHNPYGYVCFSFPWGEKGTILANKKGPRAWQKEILIEIGEKLANGSITVLEAVQIAIASGHGVGKSALVAWIILWALSTKVDTKGVVTANTETQLKTKTWAELSKWHNLAINKYWFKFTATAIFSIDPSHEKTWRIDMIPWSEHKTEAFAGLHNEGIRILIVFDEASAIPDKIYEVTEGALSDENTEIIWCCFGNPTRTNGRFRECFRKFKHRWINRQIDARSVDGTDKNQIQKWEDDYGEDSDFFKVRVKGTFPSSSTKQFISTAIADESFNRKLEKHQYDFAPVILTCDPAWTGDDDLIIGYRQGNYFKVLETIPKNDNDFHIASLMAKYEDELGADAVFIDMGYGTGIYSAGKTMGREWILVSFGGASSDIGCHLKRSEMINKTKEWLKQGGSLEGDRELYNEVIEPETVERLDGKIQIESKKAMKKRGIPSPNRLDALALSFAFPVSKKRKSEGTNKQFQRGSQGWMG